MKFINFDISPIFCVCVCVRACVFT